MSEKKVTVPDGMLKAALAHMIGLGFNPAKESTRELLEAALRWQSENPIVPTWSDMDHMLDAYSPDDVPSVSDCQFVAVEWQRRMYLAPAPEVTEEIKRRWESSPTPETMIRIAEAFRRGSKPFVDGRNK